MTRKILSMSSTYDAFNFPDLDIPQSPPIVGIKTTYSTSYVYDEEGNIIDEVTSEGQHVIFDETWKPEEKSLFLMTVDDRSYYSIHQDYTMEILKTSFVKEDDENPQFEFVDEEPLFDLRFHSTGEISDDFVVNLLETNLEVRTKYREDDTYLDYLGLPRPNQPVDVSSNIITHPLSMSPEDTVNFFGPVILPEPEPSDTTS
jgi:hypothetical protein